MWSEKTKFDRGARREITLCVQTLDPPAYQTSQHTSPAGYMYMLYMFTYSRLTHAHPTVRQRIHTVLYIYL